MKTEIICAIIGAVVLILGVFALTAEPTTWVDWESLDGMEDEIEAEKNNVQ